MVVSSEEILEGRKQLQAQINRLPEGQREQAQEQLNSMTDEAIAAMIEQQRGQGFQRRGETQSQKGIFRMLVDGDIPSKKIDENKEVIAIISKKAISKGHIILIPKKAIGDSKFLPGSAFSFAKKIAGKISLKLKASSCEIQTESSFGEAIVNVIPVYDKPLSVNSPRYDASEEEMEEVYKLLRVVKKPEVIRIKKPQREEKVLKLRRRVA
ncbi:HIT domain-containing protein [Candidatus Pacearchaeota archaeon]|nr:HIT domain-containing protein [Candidatus Pacearchaeota archaeon]